MSVASMLENMKRRALDSTYDAYICEEYDAWAVESFATEEGEYDAARLELPKVLSSEQMEKLKTMEERYRQNRKYASHYGFEAGLFSGFQLFFSGNGITEDGFDRYLMKCLMEMPGMQCHVDYYARNDEILRLGKDLGEELTDENKEHVVSLECAWGQRIHSFACHAFYCGYRAALRVIDAVGGLESMSMIDHTLLLEYRLGYIGSYEQVEREQERKKKTA